MVVILALAAVTPAIAGPNGSDEGTICVLNTQLLAANETTGSISVASGHAQIKVRNDGTTAFPGGAIRGQLG